MRSAFIMRLNPGAGHEYRELHSAVWPQLEAEFGVAGIQSMSIFEALGLVVVFSEVTDEDAWRRLWDSPIHRRWSMLMQPLLEFGIGGLVDTVELGELYRFPPELAT